MRIFLLALLLSMVHSASGQTPESPSTLTKEYILQKARTQKTWTKIIGFTGLGLLVPGVIMYMADWGDGFTDNAGANERTARTGETLMYVGGGMVLLSVPLQLASNRNQKIAASLAVESRRIGLPQHGAMAAAFRPFLSLKIHLNGAAAHVGKFPRNEVLFLAGSRF